MLLQIAVIVTFLFALSFAKPKPSLREFPSYVEISEDCGGVLLDSTTVLTSAKCKVEIGREVRVGRQIKKDKKTKVVLSRVSQFIPHENFNSTSKKPSMVNDIAIVKLATPILEVENFITYAKPTHKRVLPKTICTLVGFGGEYSDEIHKLPIHMIPIRYCPHQEIPEMLICGINKEKRRDETIKKWNRFRGAALYCTEHNEQIFYGVVTSYDREQLVPGEYEDYKNLVDIFTNTLYYKKWIGGHVEKKIIGTPTTEVPVISKREFPSYVEISEDCGGVLLDSLTVLTSAKCKIEIGREVRVGRQNNKDSAKVILSRVSKFVIHPSFSHSNKTELAMLNDIAIVKLETPIFERKDFIEYATAAHETVLPNTTCTLVGFGGEYSDEIHKSKINMILVRYCPHYKDKPKMLLCGINWELRKGENQIKWYNFHGAPLYCLHNNEQVFHGLVTVYDIMQFVPGYYQDYKSLVDIFTNALYYKDWIGGYKEKVTSTPNSYEFPSYVELSENCGGVLLNAFTILTSAKCNLTIGREVRVGRHHKHDVRKVILSRIKEFIIHDKFINSHTPEEVMLNDIAIVKLETPIFEKTNFTKYAKSADKTVLTNTTCTIVGFGGEYSDGIHKSILHMIPTKYCPHHENKPDMLICGINRELRNEINQTKWHRFHGAPLYCLHNHEQIFHGLVTIYDRRQFVPGHLQDYQTLVDIFTNAVYYKKWIDVNKVTTSVSPPDIREFLSYVELSENCGGVLLDAYTILTSAKCNIPIGKGVRVGRQILYLEDENVTLSRVKKFIVHEHFTNSNITEEAMVNDIAIVKLETPIYEVENFAKYAKLSNQTVLPNTTCTIVAFGSGYSDALHKSIIHMIPVRYCPHHKDKPDMLICGINQELRNEENKIKWHRFYGAPLYCLHNHQQVFHGLVTIYDRRQFVPGHLQDYQNLVDIFTNAFYYKNWIDVNKVTTSVSSPDIREFLSYVELSENCGGVLLDVFTILTSAKCNIPIGKGVRVGRQILNLEGENVTLSRVKKFIIHEDFTNSNITEEAMLNDIAIVKLETPIFEVENFTKYAKPSNQTVLPNTTCTIVAFGSGYSDGLHKSIIHMIPVRYCPHHKDKPNMLICGINQELRNEENQIKWHRFHGAPLYCLHNHQQVFHGLVTIYDRQQFVPGLPQDYQNLVDIFTHAVYYKKWIEEHEEKPIVSAPEIREFLSYVELGEDCGGVLLDSLTILTSAKCNISIGKEVRVGQEILKVNMKLKLSVVKEFIIHKDFVINSSIPEEAMVNDIAIVKLKAPIFELTNFTKYAKLSNQTVLNNSTCTIVGFGKGYSDKIHKAIIHMIPATYCTHHKDKPNMVICGVLNETRKEENQMKWHKFKGAALYCDYHDEKQVFHGLVTFYDRRQFVPGHYQDYQTLVDSFTNVVYYKDWIEKQKHSTDEECCCEDD